MRTLTEKKQKEKEEPQKGRTEMAGSNWRTHKLRHQGTDRTQCGAAC